MTKPALPVETITATINAVESLSGHVFRVFLELPSKPVYDAGQYLHLVIDEQSYPFSIANAPSTNIIELHIRQLEGHEAAERIVHYLQIQERVDIELPFGDVTLNLSETSETLIMVATSTGFSQLKALIEAAQQRHSQQAIHLYWANAHQADAYLTDLPREWAKQYLNFQYHPLINENVDEWEGRTGFLHDAILEDFTDLSNTCIYACGSPAMVYATLDGLKAAKQQSIKIYSDVFAYAPRNN